VIKNQEKIARDWKKLRGLSSPKKSAEPPPYKNLGWREKEGGRRSEAKGTLQRDYGGLNLIEADHINQTLVGAGGGAQERTSKARG